MKKKNVKIPKNQVLIGVQHNSETAQLTFYDTNRIKEIKDNTDGMKYEADFIVYFNDEIKSEIKASDELNSVAFIKTPFKKFVKTVNWL